MDYGKYRYEQRKKEREQKKKQNIIHVKELTMGPAIEAHDYEVKLKKASTFLSKGDKVKLTIRFKGRQIVHKEKGEEILSRFREDLQDVAVIEKEPVFEGRRMMLVMAPKKS
jgi:translation initiation factor IF-3